MTITKVEYRRLESFGDYQNHTIGAVADVEDGENPESALAALKAWVKEQFVNEASVREEKIALEADALDLRFTIERYEQSLADLRAKWEKARAFLEHHGIDTNRYNPELPF